MTKDQDMLLEGSNVSGELDQIEYWFVAPSSHPRLVTLYSITKIHRSDNYDSCQLIFPSSRTPRTPYPPLQGVPQSCHCTVSPSQNLPPLAGFGLSHVRKRLRCPSPQVTLHCPHNDQTFQVPSTTESANMSNDAH